MKPWRAALTSATASGKSKRIASRSAIDCSSAVPGDRELRERRRGQLDRGVQRERRELLALRLLHRLGLRLGELAEAAQEILRIAAEREAQAAAFHAAQPSDLPSRRSSDRPPSTSRMNASTVPVPPRSRPRTATG